jgi:hypothetical protein
MKCKIDPSNLITDGDNIPAYAIQPTGTICVDLACSNRPFRLAYESDISALFAVLGQTRHILLGILHDPHERIIPPILSWSLLAFDISRDVVVSHASRIFLPKYNPLYLEDVDRVFRLCKITWV